MQNRNSTRARPASAPCPNCRRLISINAEQCIHCGYRRPRLTLAIPLLNDLINERVSFTDKLVLACFVLYVLALTLDMGNIAMRGGPLAFLSPSGEALYRLGMGGRIPWDQGRWWTLLTATYLHGSLLHILFNMLWLRQLGAQVEALFGASRFLVIYTLAGVAGVALSSLAGTPYTVGASGAVFGLFGAQIVYGLQRGGVFGKDIFRQSLLWAALLFFMGVARSGVDNWGHFGGLAAGLAAALLLGYQEKGRQKLGHHLAAFLTVVLIVLCFGLMVASYFLSGR